MAPELKVVKLKEKVVLAQLDFNNPEHRDVLRGMVISSTLSVTMDRFKDAPLVGPIVVMLLNETYKGAHDNAWGKAYKLFPHLEGVTVNFNAVSGEFTKVEKGE